MIPTHRTGTFRLILVPAVISLAVTLLRLAGEIRHWSPKWFSTQTGTTVPSTPYGWILGITWLALPFGAYFALKLAASGEAVPRLGRRVLLAIAGVVVMYGSPLFLWRLPFSFPRILLLIWLYMIVAAAFQYFAWPALFKTLLAYGFAARIPVAIVMLLAMTGGWGTHYDYVGMPPQFSMPLVPRFFWLAFFPQLIFWVGFTIVAGSVGGVLASVLRQRRVGGEHTEAIVR